MKKYKCGTCGLIFDDPIKIIDRYDNESSGCPRCRDECLGWADIDEENIDFSDY